MRGEEDRGESVLVGGVDVDGGNFEENLDDAMETTVSGEMKSGPTAKIGLKTTKRLSKANSMIEFFLP